MLFMLMGIVGATDFGCTILDGNCSVQSTVYENQTYGGTTYYNTSVNVTIAGNAASDVSTCKFCCITNKSHGNVTNRSSGDSVNISWCSLGASIVSGSDNEVYPENISAFVTSDGLCNGTFSVWLNGTTNIVMQIRSSQSRANETGFPLIPVGAAATLLISAMIIRRWYKMRRT